MPGDSASIAGLFEGVTIVDVLNTGISGFAILMLWLGYRLLAQAQRRILEPSPDAFGGEAQYEIWINAVRAQSNNARIFLAVAVLFFLGALVSEMLRAEANLFVNLHPPESEPMPIVKHHGKSLEWNEDASTTVRISDQEELSISIDELVRRLREIKAELESLKRQGTERAVAESRGSDEAGLGVESTQ